MFSMVVVGPGKPKPMDLFTAPKVHLFNKQATGGGSLGTGLRLAKGIS